MTTFVSAAEALKHIQSGDRVFVQGQAATPTILLDALAARAPELRDVETVHLHLEGTAPHAHPDVAASFRPNAFFVGANLRLAVEEGRADYTPIFLSEIPRLFRKGVMPLDAALVHVSPPDAHGFVSLGTSVDATLAATQCARVVIAQMNPKMPRTLGDGAVHLSRFTAVVNVDLPLFQHSAATAGDPVEDAIGQRVAGLIEDGATLQMGIGAIPDAVLRALTHHRALGVHTEMFSDGLLPLLERGVVTNEFKMRQRGRTVASFVMGTQRLYDFVHDNPSVELRDCSDVNDTAVIRQQPKMTAINSAIEVDMTGQVAADSIGERVYSGVGGQMDFIRGATLSEGGKAIIALPSTTAKGESRIVPRLKAGATVVTTRAHVRYVVTEHGVADLYAKSLAARVQALISIAAPQHREALEVDARRRHLWVRA
ncbi:MAG: acetyl-CoA hydrolase/transferase C-terminal domain-containing protein [Archangium sp.]|nr:acetyl-CoA hydrolase/transferase C-terminal domain-containing protein [Archangium sp.]MDP3570471.1 acetyl-CoA hydrolase/transferase C-terminal domain-containing protein [Archangium sp.]